MALPFAGSFAIRAMRDGDYQATIYPGTQAGYDDAVAAMGSGGIVVIGPGATGITYGTPPAGVVVLVEDGDGLRLVGTNAALYLRDAVLNGNGATDPALYSFKVVDLSTAISAQADKNVDIKTRYTGSSAFTNLSLNGLHSVNQYGLSGSGGGDVNNGIALGGYSEYRGNSTITGSLYGGEFATTMYNSGTTNQLFGSLNTAQVATGVTATVTALRGMQALARVIGSGSATVTEAIACEGVASLNDTASGTVTAAYGGRFSVTKAGGASGTIAAATGVYVPAITAGGTNNFGIRVAGAASGGSGTNQSLRVDAGSTYLGGQLQIGAGAAIQKVLRSTASLNFDLTAVTVQDLTMTVTGAALGDSVFLGVPNGSVTTSVQYTAWVSASDTVTVRARTSAAGENPASGTFSAVVFQF